MFFANFKMSLLLNQYLEIKVISLFVESFIVVFTNIFLVCTGKTKINQRSKARGDKKYVRKRGWQRARAQAGTTHGKLY